MREFLFDRRTGFYCIDKPSGFEWGPGEYREDIFCIVRVGGADWLRFEEHLDALRNHRMRLKAPIRHSGRLNVWRGGVLEATPEKDWVAPAEYIVLRTGRRYRDEDSLWGSVLENDKVFRTTTPAEQNPKGMLIVVRDIVSRLFDLHNDVTLEEAEAWPT